MFKAVDCQFERVVWMHVGRRIDLHPIVILRIQEAGGVISFVAVIFKEFGFYKVNPERVSGNAFLGFENAQDGPG